MTDPTGHPPNGNGARITTADMFAELRKIDKAVDSVKQSVDETIKPALIRHDAALVEQEKQLDSLNVKFYGLLGGGVLGGLAVLADALGVLA